MRLVKTDKFRSPGKGVNENYDMVRVTIDMPLFQWNIIRRELELPYRVEESPQEKGA